MAYRYSLLEEGSSVNQSLLIAHDDQPSAQSTQTSLLDKKPDFNILEKLKYLRDNKKFCDVTLEVRGVTFVAHKNVLASWSPTFASKLFADDPKVFKDYIVVYYDNCEVFSDLLDFMYNGYVAPRETNFLQLLHLAVSFQIETLKNYCEEFLRCNLHLGNFVSTYFLSRKFKLETLEEFIVGFLQLNLSDAVKQGEFLSLRAEKFNNLLSEGWMKKIKPEIKLFLIISWVGYDVQEREKYLVHLLGHINWSTVANDFLLEINRTENFFTSHESSLYLLLQTLHSAGIALGPYKDAFPALRQTHSAILKEVFLTSLQVETEEFFPVRIEVRPRPVYRDALENTYISAVNYDLQDVAVNTDVNSRHFEEANELTQETESHNLQQSTCNNTTEQSQVQELKYDQFETLGEFIEAEIHEIKQREYKERHTKEKEIVDETPKELENVNEQNAQMTLQKTQTSQNKKSRPKRKSAGVVVVAQSYSFVQNDSEPVQKPTPVTRKTLRQTKRPKQDDKIESEAEKNETENIPEPYKEDTDHEIDDQFDERNKAIASQIKTSGNSRSKGKRTKNSDTAKTPRVSLMCKFEDCAYITKYQQRMDKHVKVAHEASFELKCNLCQFETKEVRKYNTHMKQHFPGPPFKCDYPRCTFSAEKIKTLLSHRLSHTDERPFACECGMRFRTNNTLITHKKVHLGKKEFTCPDCGVSFATRNTLQQHRVVHSDVRPYLCHECGFSTKFQSHLICHKRIHSGEVFRCQFPNCTYFSPKRSQLKAHMRAHLGIRTHVCEICSKNFVERSHLVRHQKLHTNVRISCSECDYTTTRKDKLKEHMKKHHSGETPVKPKKVATLKKKTQKTDKSSDSSENTLNKSDLATPMLVKWDHGSYSLSQEQQEAVPQVSSDSLLTEDGEYCVLRDPLSSAEPIQQMLTVEQIGAHMVLKKPIDPSTIVRQHGGMLQEVVHTDTALSHGQTVTGVGTTVSALTLLSSSMSSVDPAAIVSSKHLETGEPTHAYTIIDTTPSHDTQQPEYAGLNAFMAFIE